VISTDKTAVWLADSSEKNSQYLAIFNLSETESATKYDWKDLGLTGKRYELRNLWEHKDLGSADSIAVTLPPHGSVLYRLSRH
jgi:alpha-galactosidase